MLEVQKYLQNHTYKQLEDEYGVQASEYDDRVALNYNQIDSHKERFNPLVMECRGLILSKPDHKVLCRSFDRFFNYGEDPNSDKFDIKKAIVMDKIDGSLCNVYHDGDKWQVATRKMAFAEGTCVNGRYTFAEIFKDAIGDDLDKIFQMIAKNLTIIFEMVSPETRVVTPYPERAVYLLDVRDRDTGIFYGQEITWYWNITPKTKWKYPDKYSFTTFDEVIKSSQELPALEEGYVAVLNGNWRIKIKNPAYLAIAHLRENGAISEKRITKLVFMQDHEEYLLHFPEDRPEFERYIKAYDTMMDEIRWYNHHYKSIEDQKEFALKVKDCIASGFLFGMRKGLTIEEMTNKMTDNHKTKLLNAYIRKDKKMEAEYK